MKRIHLSVGVADIARSVEFYTNLFGADPTVRKPDYAKWLLDDPQINFSINRTLGRRGVDHVGLQAETAEEFDEIKARLESMDTARLDEPMTDCCYARSTKSWVRDPDDVTWETFVTHGQVEDYGSKPESARGNCC